jgi:hypothetical protein
MNFPRRRLPRKKRVTAHNSGYRNQWTNRAKGRQTCEARAHAHSDANLYIAPSSGSAAAIFFVQQTFGEVTNTACFCAPITLPEISS